MKSSVRLRHVSRYAYPQPARLGPHVVRLRPAPHTRASVRDYSFRIEPQNHTLHWQQDPYGNWQARVVFPEPARELVVEAALTIARTDVNPFAFLVDPEAARFPFAYPDDLRRALAPYLVREEEGDRLDALVKDFADNKSDTIEFLVALNQRIHADVAYAQREEPGVQTPEETLRTRSGACRDMTWLLIQALRRLGFAARYVSGYHVLWHADRDEGELHAWAEVYLPGAGWIGLDPTAGLLAGDGHVPLAATAHYDDAAPILGTSDVVASGTSFSISLAREDSIDIADADWAALDALGLKIDDALSDVRLTMGGEPTFIAADNQDAPEWRLEALGADKFARGEHLIARLRDRFAPGGLVHLGQGKWYPGESAPRWAFSLHWRKDAKPLWRAPRGDAPATLEDARNFAASVASQLGVAREYVLEAYEDPQHWLREEARLPPNIAPGDPRVANADARAEMARVFDRGLEAPAGFVIPLRRVRSDAEKSPWRSEKWAVRRDALILSPGASEIGHRLPLESLPWVEDYPLPTAPDPTEARGALPDSFEPLHADPGEGPVRTAMTIEPRDGGLSVFMPPVERLEHYLELLAALEKAAHERDIAIRIAGYPPPKDHRLNSLSVTPDPGVLEINVHPSADWRECVAVAEGLYEDARACGLVAHKHLPDGRQVATGGGAHIVLGAAAPSDSPFFRRPDLLKSLILYWQRHPALSYFFSGEYVGPSSQAPRVDEARHESLYELEIALAQIPSAGGEAPPPWLVDRLLRNLLVDMTGNTHRAEICIDKLFSPQGPMGRLGLVELRAFEMAPSVRMSLARQALIRALVAWFWKAPQEGPMPRWGNALADRFMLPHYLWADLCGIIADLEAAGFAFSPDWFEPQRRLQFPILGQAQCAGVALQLRHALEPWPLLGEEAEAGGVSRIVDTALARVEVFAERFNPATHILACNGRRVPMTQSDQTFVAGVRYKARKPARGLHPTLPVSTPLRFDLFDNAAQRWLGGFSYGPGFMPLSEASGASVPAPEPASEFPLTLDLRRPPPR